DRFRALRKRHFARADARLQRLCRQRKAVIAADQGHQALSVKENGKTAFWTMLCCLVLIVLFGVLPLIATLASGVIADVLGCTVNEGGVYPCLWHGHDLGETLAVLFNLGWFAFATLPVALCGLAVWSAVAAALLLRRWWKRRKTAVGS